MPEAWARRARRRTWSAGESGMPVAASWAASMLVRTVTARRRGALGRAAAASAAACIMAEPPEAWRVRSDAPSEDTERTALAAVLGMSWSLRSRKTS